MAANGKSRILVVDDNDDIRFGLRRVLEREGHSVAEARDGQEALEQVRLAPPDLVILDVMMPRMDGNEVCARLKADPRTRLIPVVMHSSLDDIHQRLIARDEDADDYLVKGSSLPEMLARVRSLLRLKRYTDELENAASVLQAIANIVQRRDFYVGEHCEVVAGICARLGARLGLDGAAVARLRLGAAFHDIGKIALEDGVLQKKGPLDPDERRRMMEHAAIGSGLLLPMRTLADVVPLVRHHHERLDGSGYPDGLKGDQIPLPVRILTVADIYQALVSVRSYKPSFPPQKAVEILREESRKGWWDPVVVEALADLVAQGRIPAARPENRTPPA